MLNRFFQKYIYNFLQLKIVSILKKSRKAIFIKTAGNSLSSKNGEIIFHLSKFAMKIKFNYL